MSVETQNFDLNARKRNVIFR